MVKLLGGPLVHAGDRVEQVTLVGEREDQPVDLVGEHAGHFVKMVHNGIEYGVMAAYAEGLNIIRNANVGKAEHEADAETTPLRHPGHYQYDLNVAEVAEVRRRVKGAGEAGATAQPSAAPPASGGRPRQRRPGHLREHVIHRSSAGVRSLRQGRKPATWTPADRHPFERLGGQSRPAQWARSNPDGSRRHAGVRRWIPSQSRGRARVAVALAVIAALATAVGCVPTTTAVPPGVGSRWATGLAGHNQVVVANGVQLNSSISTVTTWTRTATGWAKTGSWAGHNGRNGWTSNHRLGDGRTPIGVFTLTAAGGYAPNPGTRLPYEYAPAFYSRVVNRVREFNYVVAIDYNRVPRTPPSNPVRPRGRAAGGGIWFHVDTNSATAGCVTVPNPAMVQVLRWLDPAKSPVILMGPASTVAG